MSTQIMLRPAAASLVASEIIGLYNDQLSTFQASKKDPRRIHTIRPSQLPFCPVSFFIHHATYGSVQVLDMYGGFYTRVGTAAHDAVQTYLGPTGRFLANWECKLCGKRRKLSMRNECCDFPMQYHEIGIDFKGVVGHIDAVFKDKYGNYWILDFKTTSVASAAKKAKSPSIAYIEQVEAYALMMLLQYNIKVKGVMLMFIKRDKPTEPVVWSSELTDADFKRIKTRMIKYKRMLKEAREAETWEEVLALTKHGACNNPYCKVCRSSRSLKVQIKKAYEVGVHKKRLPLSTLK